MDRQLVSSSNIRAIGYDGEQRVLEVEFHSGGIYRYFGVPVHLHAQLMAAPSHGSFFAAFIKDSFPFIRIQ